MKTFARVCCFIVASLSLTACGTELDWSEEVKLHDGRIIVIKRHQELGSGGFPVQNRGFVKYHHFCYPPMGIQWKSNAEYFPETFDIVDGKGYAKVSISNCILCMLHQYPETGALYFTWEGDSWKKIYFKDYPKGLRYNLLNNTHGDRDTSRDVRGLITLAEKESRDASMYIVMKAKGVSGRNETISAQGYCEKCKATTVTNPVSSEIFLPTQASNCK